MKVKCTRVFAMPNRWTFALKPVASLLDYWLEGRTIIVDPFAGQASRGTFTNDLNPDSPATHHMDAREFLRMLLIQKVQADAVLLDPPYSPRQISECYKGIGRKVTATDTQNAALYRDCVDKMTRLLKPGGVAIRCGWEQHGLR